MVMVFVFDGDWIKLVYLVSNLDKLWGLLVVKMDGVN